jgi:hypothetical protein
MTPMTEPVWSKEDRKLHLLMPEPPYVRRKRFGYITKHPRKRLYYANHGGYNRQFIELDEAKAWLLAIARLEN